MNKLKLDERKMGSYKDSNKPHEFYSFEEFREYVPRKKTNTGLQMNDESNRIAEYQFVFTAKGPVGMARRESGQIDIYFDGMLIDETGGKNASELDEDFYC